MKPRPNTGRIQNFAAQGCAQPAAGTGLHARPAQRVRAGMAVLGPDGKAIGTVDCIAGDRIRLRERDPADGRLGFVPLSLVLEVTGEEVRLRPRGDNAFGI